ncbi:MAG: dipeptidase [Halioglobus sp.]
MRVLGITGLTLAGLTVAAALALNILPTVLDEQMNTVLSHTPYRIAEDALRLHDSLIVADLHSDSTLWERDLLARADRGHVDIPRMREGNAALQIFTSVTRSPWGLNYEQNSNDSLDSVTLLSLAQGWPVATWSNLTARALYQADKLKAMELTAPAEFQMVYSAADLERLLQRRANTEPVVGGVLGTEGSHALDGKLKNIDVLFDAGFRMMSLQHFFDNKLGGSLHGESGAGLTVFGKQAVDRMLELGVMVDVSHSSPAVVVDVLDRTKKPLLVSHTGFQGHCKSERNISDELMIAIAARGGLIGVGFWGAAVCDTSPESIVAAIAYGIELVGEDHVALGSDFDGTVEVSFDVSELAVLTDEMLKAGFTEVQVRKVMGLNVVRFLGANLPR